MTGWLEALLAAALVAGLLGGVHCAAMCGGIVGAVCGRHGRAGWRYALAYNAGRITSYVTAGAIVGAAGQVGLALRGGALAHQALMAAAGSALILLALYMAGWAPLVRAVETAGSVLWRRIQPYSRRFLPVTSLPRALGLGLVWGWLPCGMVYAVLLTALATGDAVHGALVMLAFGVGTLPNLLAITLFVEQVGKWSRLRPVRIVASALIAGFGVFAILKGTQPAALAADGLACRIVPGLAGLLH
ncbi:MAG: sulfite exporter TauE/SafE family protein [Betaproteobacteria bacterium]|nr:sulfite exporter TauE/SafE family protein [Betaproteobacteria bacterium]